MHAKTGYWKTLTRCYFQKPCKIFSNFSVFLGCIFFKTGVYMFLYILQSSDSYHQLYLALYNWILWTLPWFCHPLPLLTISHHYCLTISHHYCLPLLSTYWNPENWSHLVLVLIYLNIFLCSVILLCSYTLIFFYEV